MCWALKLSAFQFEYIPRERNLWADMLTRWAVKPRDKISANTAIKALVLDPINPGIDPELEWLSLDDIVDSQNESKENPPKQFTKTKIGRVYDKYRM